MNYMSLLPNWLKETLIETDELKKIDQQWGTRILYGKLSSCGIDALFKRAKENRQKYGNTNYSDLAEFLSKFPL